MQSRNKSVVSWIAFLSLIALFVFARTQYNVKIDEFGNALTIISGICIGVGIWNNPKSKDRY